MSPPDLFTLTLGVATLLTALVAGLLFAFAVVVMPGIARLDDRAFVRAFQEVDGIIQAGHSLFMAAWVGSVLALLAAAALGFSDLGWAERAMLGAAVALYVLGVQVPTVAVNVPLNNALQRVDTAVSDAAVLREARVRFEARWNRWNVARTALSVATVVLLLVVLALR